MEEMNHHHDAAIAEYFVQLPTEIEILINENFWELLL